MRSHSAVAAVAFTLLFVGCGSSGDPALPPTFVHATADGSGTLAVNGTVFDTRGAVVRYLDDATTLTLGDSAGEFVAGSVVAVRGTVTGDRRSGTADEVVVRSVLRGPLQGRGESLLAVAGADVAIDSRTVVLDAGAAPATIEALPAGAPLEVHGFPESGTRLRATLVRVLAGSAPILVHGWTLGAPVGGTFDVSLVQGGAPLLRVDATGATTSAALPPNALVRIAGSAVAAGGPPVLTATSVDVVAQILPLGEERAIVEGLVGGGDSGAGFALGEHRVRTTASTTYEGVPAGASAAALVSPGVRLVAEGGLDRGVVVAERVRFVDALRVAGRIDPGSFAIANPAVAASFTIGGELVVADATTRATSAGAAITLRQLLDLHSAQAAGLPVTVHGYERADGAVQAQRIEVAP
jgi:hypothetical protein